jgi:acyl dehydratase
LIEALSWAVGDELERHTLPPVIRIRLITYAGASGDFTPIHLVDEAAKEAGLPGIIAPRMLTVATMGLLFFPYLEHGYVKGFRSRLLGMVSLGDVLRVSGRVSGVKEIGQGRLYAFDVYALRGDDTVASGSVEFLVYRG